VSAISEALRVALQQHQAGNTSEAEQIYRQILQADPQHANAWHLLGVIAQQDDSPWYPTGRLFRQQRRGDWSEVFQHIGGQLRELAQSRC
jgi:predicted TPR repeat methyltransferase